MTDPTDPTYGVSDPAAHQVPSELVPHFERIRKQPQALQELFLSRLSCSARIPKDQLITLYQVFCQQSSA